MKSLGHFSILLRALFFCALLLSAKASGSDRPPNFVIIFTDDQGYGDLSCYGGKHVSTPRLDKMAAEGARLTSFYVAAPVCTPSRAGLMTGCYPKRVDMARGSDFVVLLAGDRKGLNPDEITIAEVLKGAGYRTGMFGKWHLGDQPEFLPTRQGFDEFFGIPYSHDIHPFHPAEKWDFPPLALLDQEKVIEMDPDADYLTKRFTERAVDFIKKNSEEPFFVYLPHPIPHKPLHVSPPFMKGVDPEIVEELGKEEGRIDYKTRDKLFHQAIAEIDWSVGRILDTLEEEGIDENTLVIFFSDNGPAIGSAGPLKGRKGSTFEGGMREPTVIRWPGKIPAGQDNAELMTAMDLLPTFAKLAGAEIPNDRVIDGKDIWPVLAGQAKTPHEAFFYHGGETLRAVRSGKWKLHWNKGKPTQLYDLDADIGEKKNLLGSEPEVTAKLTGLLKSFDEEVAANRRPAAFVENPKPLSLSPSPSPAKQEQQAGEKADSQGTPNVVLIFADDLGYGDLGCYGATKLKTPNIDKLAAEGRRFTDAHSASAVCTPSRFGLLTGEYPFRARGGKGLWGPAPITSPLIIEPDTLTIADLFKNSGYDTSAFGKWHLGFKQGKNDWQEPLRPGPEDLGFDYYFGMPVVNSAPPYVYVENGRIVGGDPDDPLVHVGRSGKKVTPITPIPPRAAQRSPNQFSGAVEAHRLFNDYEIGTRLTEKATEWIESREGKPFFLYFSTTNVHHPFTPAKRFQGSSESGVYGDFVHELDWMVGEVMKSLEKTGVADNTLVLFTSDNGGMFNLGGRVAAEKGHQINGDLLGSKFGIWEGGHRVPFIAWWPGKIEAGTVSDQLFCSVDLLASFAALTGHELEDPKDSLNFLPALTGDPVEPIRREMFMTPNKPSHMALRRGKWMYIPAQSDGGFRGSKPNEHAWGGAAVTTLVDTPNSDIENGKIKAGAPPAQLYDLEADVNQTKNLFYEHPDVVKEMAAALKKARVASIASLQNAPAQTISKYDGFKPLGTLRFTFESGKLDDWTVVEGQSGRPVSEDPSLPRHKSRPFFQEGRYHLSTIATADGVSDQQQVVFQSPPFVIQGERASFLASGGYVPESLYVGLIDAETKKVLLSAGGSIGPQMKRTTWDVSKLKGKTVFLQVVDRNSGGWGHLTFDDFSVEGTLVESATPDPPKAEAGSRLPNVIFLLTDDLGYSDISCYGATKVKTPHIDRLAERGIRFTDFHTAASICSPSRAAFLTGAYPQRTGLYMGINPNRKAHWFLGLHPDEITLAEQFKDQGYQTHMVGKWHLGTEPEFLPRKQGFDSYYGMPCNFSHSSKFFDDDEVVFAKTPLDRLTELYTERVTRIVREAKGEPFFLYYSHNYPHTPYKAGKAFQGSSKDGVRGDILQELDWGVGEMMQALEDAGVAENTIVIFTSDNGPTDNRYARPYRGTKYVTFEGGHRVPFIVHWPAKIEAGGVSDANIHAMDLFPTLSEVIEAPLAAGRSYDGESFLPLLSGSAWTRKNEGAFYYYNCENLQAVRSGDWKLHLPRKPEQLPFWEKNKTFAALAQPILYDLASDEAESTDVARANPEVVKEMLAMAESARAELGEFMKRGSGQRPTGSLFPQHPVISHEKDWRTLPSEVIEEIARERERRYPGSKSGKGKSG